MDKASKDGFFKLKVKAPAKDKHEESRKFFKMGVLPEMGRILRVSPRFIRYI